MWSASLDKDFCNDDPCGNALNKSVTAVLKEEGFHIGSFIIIFAQTPESRQFLYLYDKDWYGIN